MSLGVGTTTIDLSNDVSFTGGGFSSSDETEEASGIGALTIGLNFSSRFAVELEGTYHVLVNSDLGNAERYSGLVFGVWRHPMGGGAEAYGALGGGLSTLTKVDITDDTVSIFAVKAGLTRPLSEYWSIGVELRLTATGEFGDEYITSFTDFPDGMPVDRIATIEISERYVSQSALLGITRRF